MAPRPGNGKCLFLFLPITCCAGLRWAGKGELLGETRPGGVGWGWGGEEDHGKFFRAPNSVPPRPAAVGLSFLCAPRWGHPPWDLPLPILGPGQLPPRRPETQAAGHAQWGCWSRLGRGDRLDRVGFSLGPQSPSPRGRAHRRGSVFWGLWGFGFREGGVGWGFIHGVTFQASVMSARNCKETPLSGCSFAWCRFPKGRTLVWLVWVWRRLDDPAPERAWGYWSARCEVDNAPSWSACLWSLPLEKIA